jgi:hypothetical protein
MKERAKEVAGEASGAMTVRRSCACSQALLGTLTNTHKHSLSLKHTPPWRRRAPWDVLRPEAKAWGSQTNLLTPIPQQRECLILCVYEKEI